ncbi:hypothetical protein AGMMS49546_28030 [Spirochaetia bacterium]|nr:hypothetical protein AGMMS49546_28030 [Spirochaetia bacterium]
MNRKGYEKRSIFLLLFFVLLSSAALEAQTREDIYIHVRPVIGGTEEENRYFKDNFEMEIRGAHYTVVNAEKEADYIFALRCEKWIDDEGKYKTLIITLINNYDGHEILTYGFDYDSLEEMNYYNLSLVYQGMANLPLNRLLDGNGPTQEERIAAMKDDLDAYKKYQQELRYWQDNRWRNRWLYVTAYGLFGNNVLASPEVDAPRLKSDGTGLDIIRPNGPFGWSPFGDGGLSLEFHFKNYLSAEAGIEISSLSAGDQQLFRFSFPLMLKFFLKPKSGFAITPYAGL